MSQNYQPEILDPESLLLNISNVVPFTKIKDGVLCDTITIIKTLLFTHSPNLKHILIY